MENKIKTSQPRKLKGVIVSDKMDKTVVVKIERLVWHKKYKKQYRQSTKVKAHDQNNTFKLGDLVSIMQCRPFSKDKKWRVIKKLDTDKN